MRRFISNSHLRPGIFLVLHHLPGVPLSRETGVPRESLLHKRLSSYRTLYVAMATFRPPFWNKGKPLSGPPLAPIRVQPFSLSGALVDTGREQAKRVVRNGKKETTTSPLCWTAGANTVVSDQDQEPIRIWILTCWWFLTVGILPGSWWAYHELGRGGWWFRDPVENASFMPRVLATARIHSVILPLLHSWTSFLNIVTFPCCVLGTFSIRSGLLAPVHSFATDDTRGIFLWWFFLLMTGISMILFYQMKQQASSQQLAAGFRPAMRQIASGGHCGVAECRAVRPYSV
ncbi:unnamed protein product [Brassica oleracea var. botrytis]